MNAWEELGVGMLTVGISGLAMAIPLAIGEWRRMRWRLRAMAEAVQKIGA